MNLRRLSDCVTFRLVCAALALMSAPSCGGQTASGGGTDSSSHWLDHCDQSADCGGGLECLCGVCTLACGDHAACDALATGAVCSPLPTSCSLTNVSGQCLPEAIEPEGALAVSTPVANELEGAPVVSTPMANELEGAPVVSTPVANELEADVSPIEQCVQRPTEQWSSIATSEEEPAGVASVHESVFWGQEHLFVLPPTGAGGVFDPCLDRWSSLPAAPEQVTYLGKAQSGVYFLARDAQRSVQAAYYFGFEERAWDAVSVDGYAEQSEMIVLATENVVYAYGGHDGAVPYEENFNAGVLYDRAQDRWVAMPTEGAPAPRSLTNNYALLGDRMAIWGGAFKRQLLPIAMADETLSPLLSSIAGLSCPNDVPGLCQFGDGAIYDPKQAEWVPIGTEGAPSARMGHLVAAHGDKLVVYGGFSYDPPVADNPERSVLNDGALYEPETQVWTPIVIPDDFGTDPTYARWYDGKMVVGRDIGDSRTQNREPMLFIYDVEAGTWTRMPAEPIDFSRQYDVATNSWRSVPQRDTETGGAFFIWTNEFFLQWGGEATDETTPAGVAGCIGTVCEPTAPTMHPVNGGAIFPFANPITSLSPKGM